MPTFTELFTIENPKAILMQRLVNGGSHFTFGEILDEIAKSNRSDMRDAFLSLSVDELMLAQMAHANAKPTQKRAKAFSDEERVEYTQDVLDYITTHGLNDSWGSAPLEIRTALGRGSENQIRDILRDLVEAKAITSVGVTRGLRYVVLGLKSEAEKAFADYKASKKAA